MGQRRLLAVTVVLTLAACGGASSGAPTTAPVGQGPASSPASGAPAAPSPVLPTASTSTPSPVLPTPSAPASSVPLQDVTAGDHSPVALSAVTTAFSGALPGASDPRDPGLIAALPKLLRNCQRPPEPFKTDAAYRCLTLAAAANIVYRDTGDERWFTAATAAYDYTWNAKFPGQNDPGGLSEPWDQQLFRQRMPGYFATARPAGVIPVRKGIIDAAHPVVSVKTVASGVVKALNEAPPPEDGVVSPGYTPVAQRINQVLATCRTPIAVSMILTPTGSEEVGLILNGCNQLAMLAYNTYLISGSSAWYGAALATVNYIWNVQVLPAGVANIENSPETLQFELRDALRSLVVGKQPAFIGQAP